MTTSRTATTRAAGATRGLLQIGDVAEQTGLSLRTVRHYEDVGLLPAAERSPGGFRLYDDATVQRLLVIQQMKPLEFTLNEMREILDALDHVHAGTSAAQRRAVAAVLARYHVLVTQRVDKMRQRLAGAEQLQDTLERLLP